MGFDGHGRSLAVRRAPRGCAAGPNGRHNIGTVNLDANELHFADDGSLTLVLSSDEPPDAADRANWLPAPRDTFALIVRAYVPTAPILDGTYRLPDVVRG